MRRAGGQVVLSAGRPPLTGVSTHGRWLCPTTGIHAGFSGKGRKGNLLWFKAWALNQGMVSQVGHSDSCQAWNGWFLILKIFSAILRRYDWHHHLWYPKSYYLITLVIFRYIGNHYQNQDNENILHPPSFVFLSLENPFYSPLPHHSPYLQTTTGSLSITVD